MTDLGITDPHIFDAGPLAQADIFLTGLSFYRIDFAPYTDRIEDHVQEFTMLKRSLALSAALTGLTVVLPLQASAGSDNVITLTQTPCQFVETEAGDHGFSSASKADCDAINAKTGAERNAGAKVIKLKPGQYTFRVTNKNVPYSLGFWLRGQGVVGRATLPSVSGGGLTTGTTKDYNITLTPGKYHFSCPLNPTPDYEVIVEG